MGAPLQAGVLLALISVPLYHFFKSRIGNPLDRLPCPPSSSWLLGHFDELNGEKGVKREIQLELAKKYGSTFSMRSVLGERVLYTFDPKALHHIFVKDALSYEEPEAFLRHVSHQNLLDDGSSTFKCSTVRTTLGPGVLATPLGEHHRKQRKILNPAFSIAHMKNQRYMLTFSVVVPIFYEIAHKLRDTLVKKVQAAPTEVEISSWMGRTALELIGQAGLGYSFDDLEDGDQLRQDPFANAIKALVPNFIRIAWAMVLILPWASRIGTSRFRQFVCTLFPWWKGLQDMKFTSDELWKYSTGIFDARVRALEGGNEEVKRQIGGGRDVLSLLIKENMKASDEERLTKDELLAQTALSSTLRLLALYPDIQNRLREEINEAFKDGDASYETLVSLPFLDAVCRETLRLHPPFPRMQRVAKHDIILPLHKPAVGTNGSLMKEIFIRKNTVVHVSVLNTNCNQDLWGPDATDWKPERWLQPLPASLTDANMPGVYSHLMTFSAGQRSCIGFKFSQLEMKVVLAILIQTFEFSDAGKEGSWDLTPITSSSAGSEAPRVPIVMGMAKTTEDSV
ncbi:hypothetical protein VNI00_010300 [Paramarasmius palmivorus]|uniref:Cytochrome P450 n=1 Tax=Paramarasmius palmivorus TaxID=297713 RepID=A0AAW0CH92_9AGAR